jgi:hypothetical protein
MISDITPDIWRRIVRAAFEPRLGLDGVRHALRLWDDNFAATGDISTSIRPFVYAFTQSTGRSELRTDITLQLITLLHSDVSQLPSDPNALGMLPTDLTIEPQASTSNAAPDSMFPVASLTVSNGGTLATFILKLRELLTLEKNSQLAVPHYDRLIFDFVASRALKLNAEQSQQWVAWSQAPYKQPFHCLLTTPQCTQIINDIYVYLSEWVGPVVADDLLDKTIRLVEATPTGKIISPRLFL